MASGRKRLKQETMRMGMELTKVGMCGKTNDPLTLPRASSPSQGGELHVKETSLENTEHSSHEYEDVKRSSPGLKILHKTNNNIYPKQSNVECQTHEKRNQNNYTECWRESNKISLTLKMTLGVILVVSLTSLFLVVLDVVGIIGSQCICNSNLESAKQYKEHIQPNASTSFLLKKIDMLEKNMSSLVRQLMKSKYGDNGFNSSNGCNSSNGGNDGNGEIDGNVGKKENSSSLSSITTELKKLREKQVQLDSSLTKLNESDLAKATNIQDMSTKVTGLAVAVKFLSANDSLIKSKVHNLSQAEVEFRSSLEALKQKDAEVDTSLKRAKSVEAFLNTSVSELKSVDGQMRIKFDQLSSKLMAKLNSINSTVNTMQGGPPGPQGPRGIPGSPGAGNLSQCQHQQEKIEGTSGPSSDYYVTFVEPRGKIVVGASCSSVRGDEVSLSSSTNSQGIKAYMCTCRGQSSFVLSPGQTKCMIDVWVCPRIS